MKRDFPATVTDKDGHVSYEMLPTHNISNLFEKLAHRFLKLLLSDAYGGLLRGIKENKTKVDVPYHLSLVDRSINMLVSANPSSIYSFYEGAEIKKLDINKATASLLLEIDLLYKGGGRITISL